MTGPDVGGRAACVIATGLVVVGDDGVRWLNGAARALVEDHGGSWTGPDSPVPMLSEIRLGARRVLLRWPAPSGASRRWLVSASVFDGDTVYEIADDTAHHTDEDRGASEILWRLARLESLTGQGSWLMDLLDRTVRFSEAMTTMLGIAPVTSLADAPYQFRFRPEEREKVRNAVWEAIGSAGTFHTVADVYVDDERTDERIVEWRGDTYTDGAGVVTHVMGTVRDITEQQRDRAELAYLAGHDPLTGVANQRRVGSWLAECADAGRAALLLFDVDDLSDVNDLRGHAVGDQILRHVARTVANRLGPDTRFGRLGGDEFAVIVPEATVDQGAALAERLRQAVEGSRALPRARPVTISTGVAAVERGQSPDACLARADLALYAAKAAGRNRVRPYTDEQLRAAQWRVSLLSRLANALEKGRMSLHAQPIVELATGRTIRHEVLIRLRDGLTPDVGPAEFLPIAEQTDLVRDIDRWVLTRVVDALATPAARAAGLRLDANLSARSLADDELGRWVLDLLADRGVEPARLGLEITETAAVDSLDAARALAEQLTAAGCGIALDDFGAGYGSFTYLKALPFTTIKIAGEFVRQLDQDPVDRALVAGVVGVARVRGMRTLAEQVGHDGLVAPLRALGVDDVQGFHLGRPRPLAELLRDTRDAAAGGA